MTVVSDDPSFWPIINASRIGSYFTVVAAVGVIYDWEFPALSSGQEIELIWRQRWSLMTALYLSVRYLGIIYAVDRSDDLGDRHACWFHVMTATAKMYVTINCTTVVVNALLGVIMIARLHAMYQQSRKVLILIVVTLLATSIVDGVVVAIQLWNITAEEVILSGTYQCLINVRGDSNLMTSISWTFTTIWEVLALCLAGWIAVKHFRELRGHSAGWIIGDCFTVLMKSHVVYFASSARPSFLASSCLNFGNLSPTLANTFTLGSQIYYGLSQIVFLVQMFVLGPRLILGVREFNAKLVDDSDAATAMTSIAFQEHVHVSTSSSV
ncbi:uncharacterized protein EDB91DRAFT_1080935 [Suillus paluster]|uniref:uncharacterized protein n=1 Tax=Suillus paluster TaxID=48578 RepID=UPI001B86BF45|nr:uncharacterized protein EDB91DRAFT_1080935 [Suillus paluster]KAG1744138.1 hypothetical protein EDB91DRAFT_1080935 [Suillus paluster]